MDDYQKYLNPETLSQLKGLDLKARLIVEGYTSGLHKSPYQGFSVEFAEHREYVPGDDLRYVDWKVFGKSDRYYLKRYEEETNFACHVLLDTSESMQYRSASAAVSKLEYAKFVAAALSYLVIRQHDAVAQRQAAARPHLRLEARGQGDGEAGGNQRARARSQRELLVDRSAQVVAGRACGGSRRLR